MKRIALVVALLLVAALVACSGKSSDSSASQPNEADGKKVIEKNWSYIRWEKFEKVDLEQQNVAGVKVYVLKFKAEGVCLRSGRGCQNKGDKVEWRDGVMGFEKTASGWQPALPRGDIVKTGS